MQPADPQLYERVKSLAKKKFATWPSIYASSWLVREYKKRGGEYIGEKPSRNTGLRRWFREKWIDLCQLPAQKRCGRPIGGYSNKSLKKNYPYCRPSVKINDQTPVLAKDLSMVTVKQLCALKRSKPTRRVPARKKKTKK